MARRFPMVYAPFTKPCLLHYAETLCHTVCLLYCMLAVLYACCTVCLESTHPATLSSIMFRIVFRIIFRCILAFFICLLPPLIAVCSYCVCSCCIAHFTPSDILLLSNLRSELLPSPVSFCYSCRYYCMPLPTYAFEWGANKGAVVPDKSNIISLAKGQ